MGTNSKDKEEDALKNSASCNNNISIPIHLLAAGSAAAVSAVAVQPLDVLKTRLQTNVALRQNLFANIRHIFLHEGTRGLYRGLVPTLGSVVPSISIYFTLYNSIKKSLGCPSGDPIRDIVSQSAAAGLASSATAAITNPIWLVKTRLQTQPIFKNQVHKSTLQTFRTIIHEEGVRGLYKGLGASFLASTQAMVQFPIYEELKLLMCSSNPENSKKNTCSYLAASAISASLACILTYPAEVVRSRLQAQGHTHIYTGVMHAFRKIIAVEGAAGLYRGLMTSLIKMTPAHAISFTTYEYMLKFLTTSPNWQVSEFTTRDLPKRESNIQYSFRPYLPPQFEFYRSPFAARYKPRNNPYSFSPSFSHILAYSSSSSSSPSSSSSSNSSRSTPKRWSEYFW